MKYIKKIELNNIENLEPINEYSTTGAVLLRKLSYKSIIGFGKYAEATVQNILNLGEKGYLRYLYYNYEGISFVDDILKEIRIIDNNNDYTIPKPGKNPEYGKEVNDILFNKLHYKIKSHLNKRTKDVTKAKSVSKSIVDRRYFSKGSMQRRNQGK